MEKSLDKCLSDATAIPGVIGVVCTDSQGLCLQSKGKLSNHSSGLISFLAETAAKLEPDSKDSPVVILESDSTNVYIKTVGKITTAIYKTADHST